MCINMPIEAAAIMSLIACNMQNIDMKFKNVATQYVTEEFTNNILIYERRCDLKRPEYLEIKLNPEVLTTGLNFKQLIHKVELSLLIDGLFILSIPLRFMIQLKEYETCDNKWYVTIPFNMFLDDIKMVCMQYSSAEFHLINSENLFSSCKMISNNSYLDTPERKTLAKNSHTEIVQQLHSIEKKFSTPTNVFTFKVGHLQDFIGELKFKGIHKGFFIECENVDEINSIELKINHHDRHIFNRFMARKKCTKITQTLLYFPLHYGKSYLDRSLESFEGSINFCRIDYVNLDVKFDNPKSRVCIYGLGSNILQTSQGRSALKFNLNSTTVPINTMLDTTAINHTYYVEYSEDETIYIPQNVTNFSNHRPIYKSITDNSKIMCCITHEDIEPNVRYMNCTSCHNNFTEESLKSWFMSRTAQESKQCPMCRVRWTNYNIYINGTEQDQEHVERVLNPPIPA